MESIGYAKNVIEKGMAFLCFDFCGSGNSDGETVSLGYFEQEDTKCVI